MDSRRLRPRLRTTRDDRLDVAMESGEPIGRLLARKIESDSVPEVATKLDLRLAEPPYNASVPLWETALAAFAQAGIPAILVMEGFSFRHLKGSEGVRRFVAWGRERYHTPFDDLDQPLDRDAIEQHAEVLLAFVRRVADTPSEPRWLLGAPWIGERLRTLAEGR